MNKKLRDEAAAVAGKQGFSSLQDVVRLFLSQYAKQQVSVTIAPKQISSAQGFNELAGIVNDKKLPKDLSENYGELLYG